MLQTQPVDCKLNRLTFQTQPIDFANSTAVDFVNSTGCYQRVQYTCWLLLANNDFAIKTAFILIVKKWAAFGGAQTTVFDYWSN